MNANVHGGAGQKVYFSRERRTPNETPEVHGTHRAEAAAAGIVLTARAFGAIFWHRERSRNPIPGPRKAVVV